MKMVSPLAVRFGSCSRLGLTVLLLIVPWLEYAFFRLVILEGLATSRWEP